MHASAFSPCHITGFFQIFKLSDELTSGSRGCGVVIKKGTRTDIKVKESDENKIEVQVNGAPCDCPVSRMVADEILKHEDGRFSIEVSHSVDVPLRYGFGASAAGALSTGLALNEALGLGLTRMRVGQIAHICEVRNMTGLGDIIAELHGGLVVREKEGAPGVGEVSKIPCDDYVVAFIIGEELETKAVLNDKEIAARITRSGGACLDSLLKNPSPDNFMRLSKRFSEETGLLNKEVKAAMSKLESQGVLSSMAMLGNSLFTLTDDPEKVAEMIDYKYIIADIDNVGARLI